MAYDVLAGGERDCGAVCAFFDRSSATAAGNDASDLAHNDAFERAIEELILCPRYAWPLVPLARHRCTMALALAAALPAKLETVAAALRLPFQKDLEGERLMQKMSRPRKPRDGEDPSAGPYRHD